VKEGKWDSALLAEFLLTEKLINEKLLIEINIPLFHYSMCEAKTQASKNPFISISCRISDTFNYYWGIKIIKREENDWDEDYVSNF